MTPVTTDQPAHLEPWRRAVQFTVNVVYQEPYLPSSRHRKVLKRRAELERTFGVRLVTRKEAPVMFSVREGQACTVYRRFEGKLYAEAKNATWPHTERPVAVTLEAMIESVRRRAYTFQTLEAATTSVEEFLNGLLIVGSRVYERAVEPSLEVMDDELVFMYQVPTTPGRWRGSYNLLEWEWAMRAVRKRSRVNGVRFPSVYVFDKSAVQHPSHADWVARSREAEFAARVSQVSHVMRDWARPVRRSVLERLLSAA
jgi:hypothetical protein